MLGLSLLETSANPPGERPFKGALLDSWWVSYGGAAGMMFAVGHDVLESGKGGNVFLDVRIRYVTGWPESVRRSSIRVGDNGLEEFESAVSQVHIVSVHLGITVLWGHPPTPDE